MRVAVYVPILPGGSAGGVEQFVLGLVSGFRSLADEDLDIVVVTNPRSPDWIREQAGPHVEVLARPWRGLTERVQAALGPLEPYVTPLAKPVVESATSSGPTIPDSDGFFQELDADIVHFPTQHYVRTELPCLYNPHDLQHEHYPEYFEPSELERRRHVYRTAVREAAAVDVPSQFVRQDLADTYGVPLEKIYAIDRGPPVATYCEPTPADERFLERNLADLNAFTLYPAKSWPHKNHLGLVEALATARKEFDLDLGLVCTGTRTDHWSTVEDRIVTLGIESAVNHLGFVSPERLRALYRRSSFVTIPSLFEGGGFPLLEAWNERRAVACSNVTALPEKAGEGGLLFDPEDPDDIAACLRGLRTDEELRQRLVRSGKERVEAFSWKRTARTYAALYRTVGGLAVSTDERQLIAAAQPS